jgi:hypothetical protein
MLHETVAFDVAIPFFFSFLSFYIHTLSTAPHKSGEMDEES